MKTYNFTLRQLQYVLAVAETMSFRRAAELCNVSQPTLSAQVAEMESALSVSLFERDRRGVLVTAAGRELIGRASRVLVEVDDFAEAANQFIDPLAGTLRIGVIPTIGPYLLPHLVPALRKTFPHLTLIWIEDKTDALLRALKRGDLVAALLALEADLDGLDHHTVAIDPFVLAVPRAHELESRHQARNAEQVARRACAAARRRALLQGSSARVLFEQPARGNGISRDQSAHSDPDGLQRRRRHAAADDRRTHRDSPFPTIDSDARATCPLPNHRAWMAPPVSHGRYLADGGGNPSFNGGKGSGDPWGARCARCKRWRS